MNMMKLIILGLFCVVNCNVVLKPYTHYQNCYALWQNDDVAGIAGRKICGTGHGSLISSLAMVIQFHSVKLDGVAANPRTVNQFLMNHDGFDNLKNVNFPIFRQVGIQYTETTGRGRIKEQFNNGFDLILNMNNAKNYVVLLGYLENDPTTKDDDVYYVHDPSDIKNNKVSFKDIQLGLSFKKM